ERADHVSLEALLVIDDVIRDPDLLGNAAGVVDVVEGAAASWYGVGHALVAGEAALVPELHRQADDVVSFGAQHGRDGGGVHTARHGYGDRIGIQLLAPTFSSYTLVILSKAKNLCSCRRRESAWVL